MLSKVIIRCPNCDGEASFEFARHSRIQNKDLEYFRKSKNFAVERLQENCGGYYKVAVYYPGLSQKLGNIQNLPIDYDKPSGKTLW